MTFLVTIPACNFRVIVIFFTRPLGSRPSNNSLCRVSVLGLIGFIGGGSHIGRGSPGVRREDLSPFSERDCILVEVV